MSLVRIPCTSPLKLQPNRFVTSKLLVSLPSHTATHFFLLSLSY